MALTRQERSLLKAVRDGDLKQVKALAKKIPWVDFEGPNGRTPLEEAVIAGRLSVVKALVAEGANIDRLNDADVSPLQLARLHGKKNIEKYLKDQGADDYPAASRGGWRSPYYADDDDDFWDDWAPSKKPSRAPARKTMAPRTSRAATAFNGAGDDAEGAAPEKPKFTEESLKDTFNAKNWTGRTAEMEKLWDEVPKKLQKKFDFDAALAEAKRETLKKNAPQAPALKLNKDENNGGTPPAQTPPQAPPVPPQPGM